MEIFRLFGSIFIDNDNAKKSIHETESSASGLADKVGTAFKKVATIAGAAFSGKAIMDFGKECSETAAEIKAMDSQFEQTFGDMADAADAAMGRVADTSNIVQTRLQGVGTSIYAFAKSSGADSAKALYLMETALKATADGAAYYDRSLEDTAESLQSFLKGNFANDAALGVSCTETTRNAAAMELFGKKYNDLSEIQKQETLLKMVTDAQKLSGAMGQASREADGLENVTGNMNESMKQLKGVIGEPILTNIVIPAIQKCTEKITQATDWLDLHMNPTLEKVKEISGDVGEFWGEVLEPAISYTGNAFVSVSDALQPLFDKFTALVPKVNVTIDVFQLFKNACWAVEDGLKWVADKLYGVSAWITTHQETIETIIIVIGSFATAWIVVTTAIKAWTVAVTVWNSIGAIATVVTTGFGAAVAFLTSPITIAIAIIGALIAAGVLLYKNWDTVKAKATELWNDITAKFEAIKKSVSEKIDGVKSSISNGIASAETFVKGKLEQIKGKFTSTFDDAKNTVKGAIEKIKGFFKFDWSLPKIKMPHFSITGEFSLNPLRTPKIGVEWYKKAMNNPMVLDEATIFGYDAATGKYLGGGEAGTEVVSGTNTLMRMIQMAVSEKDTDVVGRLDKIIYYFTSILKLMEQEIVLLGKVSQGQDINELSELVSEKIDEAIKREEAVWA